MFNRVRGLFARYADRHLSFTYRGHPLPTVDGERSGYLDSVTLHGNHVRFVGWTTADQIRLSWTGGQVVQRPHIQREDVANAVGGARDVGFAIEAPGDCGPYEATLLFGGAETHCQFAVPKPRRLRLRRAALGLCFLKDMLRAFPAATMWSLTQDPVYRARVKTRLGLDSISMAGPMDPALFTPDHAPAPESRRWPITIILPVYNAFDLLPEVLARVEENTDLTWTLIVVEDKSPDERVRPFLRHWANDHRERVTLLENDRNVGFIQSVNKGFAKAIEAGHHVVLLNSDAFVPRGWASRLLRPILTHDNVASTTPMSNDAEIFSVPAICTATALGTGEADEIDRAARNFNPDAGLADAPTGVGFCMALNIAYLKRLPKLDPTFGRGYGEEVDWCQKARAAGGRHLAVANLFVEHRGGQSFGSEEKRKLILRNNALIARRYPAYDRDVQQFIEADPLLTARMALALAQVAASGQSVVSVYLAHSLGGGAEHYLQNRIRHALDRGMASVILRIGGADRFQMELRTPSGETSGTTNDPALVRTLLSKLGRKRIVYSCGVGDADPITLPDLLLGLRDDVQGDEIEVLIHDYFPVSPSYCLLDKDGVFRGPVTAARTDPAHGTRRPDGTRVDISAWQASWGRLIRAAGVITVFSEDSERQIAAAYPGAAAKLCVQPHGLLSEIPRLAAPAGEKLVVGVLGNIGFQKGAEVLMKLAQSIRDREDISLVLIGNIDPRYALPRSVPVHGNYKLGDLQALVTRYGVTNWLIPSVWPETFSYTTHECLATGLTVHAFDIGAQGDAVAAAPNGRPIVFSPSADLVGNILVSLDATATQTTRQE